MDDESDKSTDIPKPVDNIDAKILHFFLCTAPPDVFKLPPFAGKMTFKELITRFTEILSDTKLLEKASSTIQNDNSFTKSFPLSPFEKFNLIRLSQIFEIQDANNIIVKFPSFFNSAHPSSSFSAFFYRVQSRNSASLKNPREFLDKFFQKVDSVIEGKTLLPFKGNADALKEYKIIVDPHAEDPTKSFGAYSKINAFYALSQSKITQKTIAFFYTSSRVFCIETLKSTVGRKTNLNTPTIDLSSFGLNTISREHLEITLATDYRFYALCKGNQILVNGILIHKNEYVQLSHGDLVDIAGALLIFFERKDFIGKFRKKTF